MNKVKFSVQILFVLCATQLLIADVPKGFKFKQSNLHIFGIAPPALIYVADSLGRRTGADPSMPLTKYGSQGNKPWNGLTEIPLSQVIQQIGGDESDSSLPSTETNWNINIYDGGKQTYTINFQGVAAGLEEMKLDAISKGNKTITSIIELFVEPNKLRKIYVIFNPSNNSVSVKRVISNDDLLNDVQTACKLNLITSSKICEHLDKMASSIKEALEDKHFEKAEELVKAFLQYLEVGESDDKDDQWAIQEPALTILKEDTKALLADIQKSESENDKK